MPLTTDALERLLVALLVGMLIGLERERAEQRKQRKLFAGVRTFPLIALLGGVLTLLVDRVGPGPVVVGFVAVGAISVASYVFAAREGALGATTEIAALGTYALGAMAGAGQIVVAGAVGVGVAVLLAAKPRLEALSRALSEAELAAVLELAVITAIVLPLLPDRGYGPWGALNPFRIWIVVVLVSAVSLAGFVAARWKGERAGLLWTAALGALVSSTAVTTAMAQRSRQDPAVARVAASAAVLASTVMCARVLVLAAVAGPVLLPRLALPMGAMMVVGLVAALWLRPSAKPAPADGGASRPLSNPFSLKAAIAFGVLYAAVLLLVRGSQQLLGAPGTFVAAGLSGLVDVDAITIALARGAAALGRDQAAGGVVLAAASNSVFKAAIGVSAGGAGFRRVVATALVTMAAVGGGAFLLATRLF